MDQKEKKEKRVIICEQYHNVNKKKRVLAKGKLRPAP